MNINLPTVIKQTAEIPSWEGLPKTLDQWSMRQKKCASNIQAIGNKIEEKNSGSYFKCYNILDSKVESWGQLKSRKVNQNNECNKPSTMNRL